MPRLCSTTALAVAASFALSFAGASAHAADAALIEAAKKEGEVVWYSTQIISQLVRPVVGRLRKEISGHQGPRHSRQRQRGRRQDFQRDPRRTRAKSTCSTAPTTVVPLKKEGYVLQWQPDSAKEYPADLKDPEGYWVANNLFIITPGFNTSWCRAAPSRRRIRTC